MPIKDREIICCAGGGCGTCCRGVLKLDKTEADLLRKLSQLAFLPLAFTPEKQPVFYDQSLAPPEALSEAIAALLQKGLITADDRLLLNYAYEEYAGFAHRGSMALTTAGQDLAELLDINGTIC